jgi:hypothetical protein
MVTQTAPQDNYPFSTSDGKVIPLDIIKPKGALFHSFTTALSYVEVPVAISSVAILIATEDCFVVFGDPPASILGDIFYDKMIYIPKGNAVATTLEDSAINVKAISTSGILYVQLIEKWAGLSLDTSFYKR